MKTYENWIKYSHKIGAIDQHLTIIIQQLSRLDQKINQTLQKNKDPFALDELVFQSYLWVLAVYELIRTLDQFCRTNVNVSLETKKQVKDTKDVFNRIRTPLAKFESSNKHKQTDFQKAIPLFHPDTNEIAWQVSDDKFIGREYLSDLFFDLIKNFKLERHNT